MSLIDDLKNGCVYHPKRWSGDCGELSSVDEEATDELLRVAAKRIKELEAALERIRDCASSSYFQKQSITLQERMDAVRQIAIEVE